MMTRQETLPPVAVDPVCGSELYAEMAPAMTERDGRWFFFCSERCRGRFELHPERFKSDDPVEGAS